MFGATPIGSEPRGQLPAVVSPQFAAPAPVSGHWPIRCIALAVHLVTAVKLSLRAAPRVLTAVFGFLGGCAPGRVMAWTTVRGWLMRLGWYALHRTLERAGDWAYLIDHTVQIGVVKCFAVVGIRLSRLPYPARCLQLEDLTLIVLQPMPHSTAAAVQKALEEAALRTGVPRLIVSDEGTDVRGGIERYRAAHHDQTVATCDLAHKGANLLRKLLEADELWPGYAARLGTTKAKLQQTSLACFASPNASSQGAVHEFGGAAALGAVVSACLGSALAGRTDRLAAPAVGVGDDRPRATGGTPGLAAGLPRGHRAPGASGTK